MINNNAIRHILYILHIKKKGENKKSSINKKQFIITYLYTKENHNRPMYH